MILVLLLSALGNQPDATSQLPAAYRSGRAQVTLQLCGMLLKKSDHQQLNQQLKQMKMPPLGKLLLDSRLALARQGLTRQARRPDAKELNVLMPRFLQYVNRELESLSQHKLLQRREAPATLEAFVDIEWQYYSLHNRLTQIVTDTKYFSDIVKKFPRARVRKLEDDAARCMDVSIAKRLIKQANQFVQTALAREMELRLARLKLALKTLRIADLSVERVYAAGTWRIDGHKLNKYLKESNRELTATRRDELLKGIARDMTEAKRLAGNLTLKAETLFELLFWWSRGRYGIGTHENGLAKHPLAHRNPALQMQVRMPDKRPIPTVVMKQRRQTKRKAKKEPPLPTYDRRHHYWWSLGEREVSESSRQFGRPYVGMVKQVETGFM